jgi:mannose-6-phosphate isomerase-like protein (cupin superfamily)
MVLVKRTVIGPNADGKSAILYRDSPNEQDIPNVARRSTLWAATELPIDNAIRGDRGADVTIREPTEDGTIFRVLEIPPDMKDRKKHIELMRELNRKVKQKYPPTEEDMERHPTMHRTDTLDCFVVVRGEICLVSDTDEVLLRAGDTVVVQGVNHAWSNLQRTGPDRRRHDPREAAAQGVVRGSAHPVRGARGDSAARSESLASFQEVDQ